MNVDIFKQQVAISFSTPFKRGEKLSLAEKVIRGSRGIFTQEQVSTPSIPEAVDDIWLLIRNTENGYSFGMSNKKVNFAWEKTGPEETTEHDKFFEELEPILEVIFAEKPSSKRIGIIRHYLVKDVDTTTGTLLYKPEIESNFTSFDATLKTSRKCRSINGDINFRVDMSDVFYTINTDDDDKEYSGVQLSVDINTKTDDDVDLNLDRTLQVAKDFVQEFSLAEVAKSLNMDLNDGSTDKKD